jgi:hypothetical protein
MPISFKGIKKKYGIGEGLKKIEEQKEIIKQKEESKKGTDGQARCKENTKSFICKR